MIGALNPTFREDLSLSTSSSSSSFTLSLGLRLGDLGLPIAAGKSADK